MEKDRKTHPLKGKKVVITRALEQSQQLKELLEQREAICILFPTIAFRKLKIPEEILPKLNEYNWIIFTSANGVRFFCEELEKRKIPFPEKPRVAVIGPGTLREAQRRGITVSLVPERFIAEGILEALQDVKGKKILIPRAKVARNVLPDTLKKRGAQVDVLPVYETYLPQIDREKIKELEGAHIITFTSPSTVENFVKILKDDAIKLCNSKIVASIGPITTEKAVKMGVKVDITASEHSLEGLVRSIENFLS